MPSVREQILTAFFEELKTLETDSIKVFRNLDKSQKVPDGGALIVLRDGQSNDPETLLSSPRYAALRRNSARTSWSFTHRPAAPCWATGAAR